MHLLDARNGYGWSAEHPVAVTRDGGATWFDATPRNAGDASTAVIKGCFTDARTGWTFSLRAAADMTVYGTRDGGRSWSKLAAVPVKYGDGNMSVTFADARHGWFEELTAGMGQSAGELFATSDGGKTWRKVAESAFGDPAASGKRGTLPFGGRLAAQRDGTLWLSGSQRAAEYQGGPGFIWLFRSPDGGRTWAQVKLPVPAANRQDGTSVSQPAFFGQSGLVTVLYTSGKAVVYASADGGKSWAARGTLPAGGWPVFADATHGWQTDGRRVYRTQDGGRSWQPLATDPALRKAGSKRFLLQLDFIDARHGWAVFEGRGADIEPMLLATTDGGKTWENVNG